MIERRIRAIAIIGLFGGIALAGSAFSTMREDKAFATIAETAVAEPVSDAVPGTPYQGALVYQTKAGQSVQFPSEHVPLAIRDRIGALKTVDITYLPADPDKVRFALWPVEPASGKHVLVGVLMSILGLAYFVVRRKRQ